jgi:hypothetical protein
MFAPQVNKERKLKELERYGLSLEDFSAEEIASWGIGDIEYGMKIGAVFSYLTVCKHSGVLA